jgi:hypothetical protein
MRIVEPELPQSTGDGDAAIFQPFDFCAERGDAAEAAGAVRSSREVGKGAGAFSEAAEHGVAMRDAFVARQAQGACEVARGLDDAFGHEFQQNTLLNCLVSIVSSGETTMARVS